MSEMLILLAVVIAASSGVPGLLTPRNSLAGQWISVVLVALAATLGLAGVGWFWAGGAAQPVLLNWPIAIPGADFRVAIDGISALFLVPVFVIALLGSVYGLGYWKDTEHPQNGRKLRLFYGLLTAAMALVVVAGNSIVFLFAWEVMALVAFFLVTTEDHESEVRAAGWVYLVATHSATLCLFALFALLHAVTGSFTLAPLAESSLSPGTATAIFVLALLGFGLKAGIMPLHVWLPSSHAIAPSHVSAIMSGVIIKMGIYGLVRITALLPTPPLAWGAVLLGLGVVSGILGVAFAVGQHDLKRLLAYHSIENIGIIVMGLALAMIGRSLDRADWVILGLAGALLHVWNHALFKALLFFSAGSVIHAVHTREIDQLGGLARRMPRTACCFLAGAVAICGLPPLNGFVSEFLIYLGLFRTLQDLGGVSFAGASLAAPALALIGALAVACFVKVYGAVFLGTARSGHGEGAHESPAVMVAPMGVLAACCLLIGWAPRLVAPALERALRDWAPRLASGEQSLTVLAPFDWVSIMSLTLTAALVAVGAGLAWLLRRRPLERRATWGCGYAAPTPRIQYTASSFAQILVGLFAWALRPRSRLPGPLPLFPQRAAFHSEVPDAVLDEAVLPTFRFVAWLFSWLRILQQGNVQIYLLYIFLALVALLLWR